MCLPGPQGHGKGDMGIRALQRIAGRLILAAGGFAPGAVLAESGPFAVPSLTVVEVYDDNIFFLPLEPQKDFIFRVRPALDAGYRSARMALHGRYAFDAEYYARHPELDNHRAREHAGLDFRYQATPLLVVAADAAYVKTQTPGELNAGTGLEFRRARAERFAVGSSLAYQYDRLTLGTASYGFTRDKLDGRIGSDTHTLALDLGRRVSRRDTASIGYRFGQFRFETGGIDTSHVLLAGGTRELTPQTAASVLVGPRYSEGSAYPEGSVSLRHKFAQGEAGIAYSRTETTVLGVAGTATTDTIGVTLAYSFGPSTEIRMAPSYLSSKHRNLQAEVFLMNLEMGYRLTRYLTLIGSYQFSSQRGGLTAPADGEINRNVALLGIVLAAPERSESAARPRVFTPSTLEGAHPATRAAPPSAVLPVEEE